jgi:hypothetical protein
MTETPMKSVEPGPADKALHADIMALVQRHLTPDTSERVLAIAAQITGVVLALQDQRKMTLEMAWDLILANVEIGNQRVIANLHETKGHA